MSVSRPSSSAARGGFVDGFGHDLLEQHPDPSANELERGVGRRDGAELVPVDEFRDGDPGVATHRRAQDAVVERGPRRRLVGVAVVGIRTAEQFLQHRAGPSAIEDLVRGAAGVVGEDRLLRPKPFERDGGGGAARGGPAVRVDLEVAQRGANQRAQSGPAAVGLLEEPTFEDDDRKERLREVRGARRIVTGAAVPRVDRWPVAGGEPLHRLAARRLGVGPQVADERPLGGPKFGMTGIGVEHGGAGRTPRPRTPANIVRDEDFVRNAA